MDSVVPGQGTLHVAALTDRGVGKIDQIQARMRDMGFETVTFSPVNGLNAVEGTVQAASAEEAFLAYLALRMQC